MIIKKRVLLLAIVVLLLVECPIVSAKAPEQRAIETTVCLISAGPENFAGKAVILAGQISSDGIERTVLVDSECEHYGIAITTPKHFKGEAEFSGAL